jgi:hypothetical protein
LTVASSVIADVIPSFALSPTPGSESTTRKWDGVSRAWL